MGGCYSYILTHSHSHPLVLQQDLEAQERKAIASAVSAAPALQGSARAGRGGAGNYVDPRQAAQSEGQLADETEAAVASRLKTHPQPHRAGWSGRGGAGNFHVDEAAERQRREDDEKGKVAELDKMIKEAVDGALKLPEKAHWHVSREEDEEEE